MAAGETNIGGIVGFLRLDAQQFHREINQALLEIEALDNKDVRVGIKTDGAAGLERLPAQAQAATRSTDQLADSQRRLKDATDKVNLATLKLSELRESGKASASQLMSAQQGLARAQRDEQDAIFRTYDANVNLDRSTREVGESTGRLTQQRQRLEAATRRVGEAQERLNRSNESGRVRSILGAELSLIRALRDEREARSGANKEVERGGAGMHVLYSSIVALVPAIVPIAAAAVGLGAAFGGMAVSGVLAFKGIQTEMQRGTAIGRAYQSGLAEIKGDFQELAQTAAGNFLAPFQETVANVTANMGALNEATSALSTITGNAAASLANGLIAAFLTWQPMIQDAAMYLGQLMGKFEELMSGPGAVAFGQYVQSVFPQVLAAIESLVGAAMHLVEALAPIGLGVVDAIRVFSDLISAIPTPVLSTLAQLAISVYSGFALWRLLSAPIAMLSAALGGVANMSARAATAMRVLSISAGVIGVAVAALGFIFTANAEKTRESQAAIDDWAQALKASNGVIDESIRQKMAQKLADEGVLDAAKKLGLNLADVTDAALGNADAQARLNAQLEALAPKVKQTVGNGKASARVNTELGESYDKVTNGVKKNNGELDNGAHKMRLVADAAKGTAGATDGLTTAVQNQANAYGVSSSTYENAIKQQQGIADKAAAATLQMQLENDAAGLLKQSLDELNGKQMTASQAQNAFEKSQLAVAGPIKQAQEAEKRAKEALEAARKSGGSGGPSQSSKDGLARAQLAQQQAADHLARLQSSGKASASSLESARNRLATANLRLQQAEGKVAGSTGKSNAAAVAAAQAAYDQAKANTTASKALTGQSEAAITNRGNLMAAVEASWKTAEGQAALADKTETGRKKLILLREQVIRNAVAQGMNTDEVRKFVEQLFKIPPSVPPTRAELDTAAALKKKKELQDAINAITGKTVTMTIQEVYKSAGGGTAGHLAALKVHNEQTQSRHGLNGNLATGGPIPGYALGTLVGPGTGTSDSLLAQVIETGRVLRVSAGEFVSTSASRERNRAALEAGNRGATLQVAAGIPKGGDVLRVSSRMPQQGTSTPSGKPAASRMHPDDIRALGRELALAVRQAPRPRVDLDDFNRRLG